MFKSDKDKLYDWLLQKKWARTSEIIRFGVENFSNRSDRNARLLRQEGKIFRMRKDLVDFRFSKIGEEVYTIYEYEAEKT